ncbi:recombination directionality factor [Pseudomonas profundi]|uniref:recombination directionality factor n=1 Tax=Pseudomonas profundi TaxID=1981513 RepID=UPI00123B0429|nr:hydrolase or metal-binding protein [Pseudomonas profundi]
MIKGLVITPPVLGRISIGKVVEKNGKRLPEKDDQFTITSQVQTREGWLPHPLDEQLRKDQGGKVRSIPVRLLFNDPELNFRVEYCLFDRSSGRPLCVGNGETCKRSTAEGVQSLPCPSPDSCPLAQGGSCKPYGRLNVAIGDDDPLGTFAFRTTGYNSIRTLTARLSYLQALSANRLACMPLELRLRGKSTRQSHGAPIYYVDLPLRNGMTTEDALTHAQHIERARRDAGFDQQALDAAARSGFANGVFEDEEDDAQHLLEEFYPDGAASTHQASRPTQLGYSERQRRDDKPTLHDLLLERARHLPNETQERA